MSRRLKVCPYYARGPGWRHGKRPRECGERDPVFTAFASLSLPTPWPACVSCTGVNRQPNLDVSSTRRGCPFRFSFGRSWPPFISHYETSSSRVEGILSVRDPQTHWSPCVSATALVSPCAKWVQVRSKVIRAGEVVSFFGDAIVRATGKLEGGNCSRGGER